MPTFQELISSDTPVLVDFYADWCQPCKTMTPILQEVAGKMGDSVRILKVDVDRNQAAAQKFQVQGVPTLILFHKGAIKWRQAGVVPAFQLEQVLAQHT